MRKKSVTPLTPLPLSLSTSSVNPLNIENAFRLAKEVGYQGVEVMVAPHKDSQDENAINKYIDTYQVPVTSIHAPTLILCQFVWGTKPEPKLEKTIQLAKAVGAESIVVHPPFARNPYAKRFLDVIRKLEDHSGLNVAVENMFPWSVRGHKKEIYGPSWEITTESMNSLTFDFSHAAASGMDILPFIRKYHEKIKVVHLCDGSSRQEQKGDAIMDEHLLPGEGTMPIKEVYQVLRENNWKGKTVLEINTRNCKTYETKIAPLAQSLSFFQTV